MRRRSLTSGSFGRHWLCQRRPLTSRGPGRWRSQWHPEQGLAEQTRLSGNRRSAQRPRPGMTLIEVLLALAILALVMGAVASLVNIGTRAATAAEDTALAQLVAESKMNELASGAAPMSATGLTDYEGREGWQYSVEITPIPEPAGLVSVKVFVQQVVEGDDGVTFELYRWMPSEGFLDMALTDDAASTESGTTTDSGLALPGSAPPSGSGDSP